jgi:hypothetical protein
VRSAPHVRALANRCISMVRKLAVPIAASLLLLVGCGSQSSTSSTGAAGKPAPKHSKAQRYLTKLAHRPQVDNEGPEVPRPGRAPTWSYRVSLAGETGSARALINLHGNHVCWRFERVRTHSSPLAPAIHVGAKGHSGHLVVVFGASFTPSGCIVVRPVVVNSIAAAPHFYYVSVATANGHGALRSQL